MLISFKVEVDQSAKHNTVSEIIYAVQTILRNTAPESGSFEFTEEDNVVEFEPSELTTDEYTKCIANVQAALYLSPDEAIFTSEETG